jgi:hypothetical protein
LAPDTSEQELHDIAIYLREYGRRVSRLLPAVKSAQAFGEDIHDVEISLDELLPLDIESALRPFCESLGNYAGFQFQWALRDLLQKLRAIADFNIARQFPRGLYSFIRHATRVVGLALLRLERAEADETGSLGRRRRDRVKTLRQRVPAFDDFLRTPPEVMEIIRAYRGRLDDHMSPLGYSEAAPECSPDPLPCLLQPEWVLPYSKDTIEKALRTALGIARNRRIRRNLTADLELLKNYRPADAIPSNTMAHIDEWKRLHATRPRYKARARVANRAKHQGD